ncbi:hypothetical protein [Devosia sp. FKR38]|uniref:hypothetical protein n=1 Tax=Devosia sp. FKR38 TaxID=2562312 RepID=UPI0010C097DB|nr:hypothetical protein [Devosia sp. FKR38]
MNIVLSARLFDNPPPYISLAKLAYFALEGRHRIAISDESDPAFKAWLASRLEQDRHEWEFVLDSALLASAREPARLEIEIVPANLPSNWNSDPPQLQLAAAINALDKPIRVIVENGLNDRAFLLAMATNEHRSALEHAERSGFLEFSNGGGITTLLQIIVASCSSRGSDSIRTHVLVDSDALQPNAPSEQSENVRSFCDSKLVWCHQLERRAIENYLPPDLLRGWAYAQNKPTAQQAFDAYISMSPDQRRHYNMKKGFKGDAARQGPTSGTLYGGLELSVASALSDGFGTSIANLFTTCMVTEDHSRRDGSWDEINRITTDLIARLR